MMTFKQFVHENVQLSAAEAQEIYSPRPVSTEEFIDWCESNARRYLKNISNQSSSKIYRGFKHINAHLTTPVGPEDINNSTGKIDTNKMNRMSANTFNYYTLWMDNHPSWSKFPKRSKALVCSTNIITASQYARKSYPQLIIPADSNKIGICSGDDLWFSFDALADMAEHVISGDYSFSMDKFMTTLYYGLSGLGISENEAQALQTNYSSFESVLKRATRQDIQKIIDSVLEKDLWEKKYRDLEKLLVILEKTNLNSLYDLFVKGLDPKRNNFKAVSAAEFRESDDTEIWVQGLCYTIDTAFIEKECKNKNEKMMYDFLNKYNLCTGLDY